MGICITPPKTPELIPTPRLLDQVKWLDQAPAGRLPDFLIAFVGSSFAVCEREGAKVSTVFDHFWHAMQFCNDVSKVELSWVRKGGAWNYSTYGGFALEGR